MDSSQLVFSVIVLVAIFLFMSSWLRVDVIGILIIVSLSVTGLLNVTEALSGFSSEPAIIVASVFVLSAALAKTGVTDLIADLVGRMSGRSEFIASLVIMIGVAVMSSVTHHLMITAMMLPIVMKLSRQRDFSPSRLLIPMAMAASLGSTLTLIGAPAFLLANQIIKRSGETPLGLFSVSAISGPILLASLLLIVILRWILPKNPGQDAADDRFKHTDLSTELVIPPGSRWAGKKLAELRSETVERFRILYVFRGHKSIADYTDDIILHEEDVLLVQVTSDELVSIDDKTGVALRAFKKFSDRGVVTENPSLADQGSNIVEAIIGPNSDFVGKSISKIGFFDQHGVVVMALWRQLGWIQRELAKVVLIPGDLIVLWGAKEKLEKLTQHQGFLVFLPFHGKGKLRTRIPVAISIMAAAILTASFGWVPAHIAFLAGALAMVLFKCVSMEEAYDSIENRIFVMIAGVIPLGLAMQKVGIDKLAADFLLRWTGQLEPFWMLMIFFWFAALLTQVMSDAATTVLIAPIAVAFAKHSGIPVTGTVVCVTMGAVASFLTPIGHHGNLLVLNPGRYQFSDFLKIGLPLTILVSVLTCYLSLNVWR